MTMTGTETQPQSDGIDRRTFIKGAGLATGTVATGAGASALDLAPVDEAEAIHPVVIGAGVVGAAIAAGWLLRDREIIGSDTPPEGLTASALQQEVVQTARTRKSTLASTFVDNRNIIQNLPEAVYADAKLACIEALNAGKTKSEVISAGQAEVDKQFSVPLRNLTKSWNEAADEAAASSQLLVDHPDVTVENGSESVYQSMYGAEGTADGHGAHIQTDVTGRSDYQLPDGSTVPMRTLRQHTPYNGDYVEWSPLGEVDKEANNHTSGDFETDALVVDYDGQQFQYMGHQTWKPLYDDINAAYTNVSDGIVTWVDGVYGQVQQGEIEVSDLLTPREQAEMMSDQEGYPQAVADLIALNVPVDLERKATVQLHGHDVTVEGTLGVTNPPGTLETGTRYNPSADSLGTVYLTYDVGTGQGTWTEYNDAIDGGNVTFTKQPLEKVTYSITTNYDETATAVAGDFTKDTSGTEPVWTVDLSGQLDNQIATVDGVTFETENEGTRYETIKIEGDFTIQSFVNEETGEEASQAQFTKTEPQTDSNYVTQEEWEDLQQKNQELIEKYEDSQTGAGGGWFGGGGGGGSLGIIALGVAAIGAIFALGQSNDN